jgi:hypothetical protein
MTRTHKAVLVAAVLAIGVGLAGAKRARTKKPRPILENYPAAEQAWRDMADDARQDLADIRTNPTWTVEVHPQAAAEEVHVHTRAARAVAALRGVTPPQRAAHYQRYARSDVIELQGFHAYVQRVAPDGSVTLAVNPIARSKRGGIATVADQVYETWTPGPRGWTLTNFVETGRWSIFTD